MFWSQTGTDSECIDRGMLRLQEQRLVDLTLVGASEVDAEDTVR